MAASKVRTRKAFKFAGFIIVVPLAVFVFEQLLVKVERVDADLISLHLTFAEHDSGVWTVVFSPDGDLVASSGIDPSVKIWQRSDGLLAQSLEHQYGVPALTFSPDGEHVATGSYDGFVRVWSVSDGQLLATSSAHDGVVWGLTYSPDGQTIASGSSGGAVRLWNISSNELRSLVGHEYGDVWSLVFSPDGSTLASGGHDHLVKIWDIASGGDDKSVKLWDTTDWSLIRTLRGKSESVYGVAFSPDGKRLVSGSRDKKVLGEILQYRFAYEGSSNGITVRLWDVGTGELLQSLNDHTNDVNSVAYSADGIFIATASEDATVKIWRLSE